MQRPWGNLAGQRSCPGDTQNRDRECALGWMRVWEYLKDGGEKPTAKSCRKMWLGGVENLIPNSGNWQGRAFVNPNHSNLQ